MKDICRIMINLSIRFQNFVGIGAGGNQTRTVGNGCGPDIQRIWIIVPYGSCTGIFTGLSAGLTGGSSFFRTISRFCSMLFFMKFISFVSSMRRMVDSYSD